jgi:hypothetical protein
VHLEEAFLKTGRELRERYFSFMAVGAYTSLPYLAFHPEGYKHLTGAHWRRSYDGKSYRQATITRFVLGVGPALHEKLSGQASHRQRGKLCEPERERQLQAIRENIERAGSGGTVPLPRDLLMGLQKQKREQELLREKEKYEQEREAKVAAGQASKKTKGHKRNRNRRMNKRTE